MSLRSSLTRRSFLAGAAALGATGSLVACAPQSLSATNPGEGEQEAAAPSEEKICAGTCRGNCEQICPINVHVRDGVIVRTSAAEHVDPRYQRICLKGLSLPGRIYDTERIKYPMKRVSWSPEDPHTENRGTDEWERISWDEAFDYITSTWKKIIETDGPEAIATVARGNYGYAACSMINIVSNLLGCSILACRYDTNNQWPLNFTIGTYHNEINGSTLWTQNEPHTMAGNAKHVILWGSNMVQSHVQFWHFVREAEEAGANLISIDPLFSSTAAECDEWIPIRPATDSALALAMCNVIIEENLIDYDFLKTRSCAPFLVKDDGTFLSTVDIDGVDPEGDDIKYYVIDADGSMKLADDATDPVITGVTEANGVKVTTAYDLAAANCANYTPEYASEITDIPADKIRYLARTYADGPTTICSGYGYERWTNGYLTIMALSFAAALTGNLAKPGASMGTNCGFLFLPTPGPAAWPGNGNKAKSQDMPTICKAYLEGKENPYGVIKALYLQSNHAANDPGMTGVIKSAEFVVVAGFDMNDTAYLADILLPSAFWFEYDDIVRPGNSLYLTWNEKAIDPPYECKTDHDIWVRLANDMGLGEYMPESPEAILQQIIDENELINKKVSTVQELRDARYLKMADQDDMIYGSEECGGFHTPSGRVEFYIQKPTSRAGDEPDFIPEDYHLPQFIPPVEAWTADLPDYPKSEFADDYPFYFLQMHTKYRTQSQFWNVKLLREYEPEPVLYVNPSDAQAKGISDGDYVKVFNDRAELIMKCVYHNGMRPGVTMSERAFQARQFKDNDKFYNEQDLIMMNYSPFTHSGSYFDVLIDFEKYEGAN